jgi:hypothetical protein
MHDHHNHHGHSPHHHEQPEAPDSLKKLQMMLEHWIEHSDSHEENYREWAAKARDAGEEEIAREIHLAIDGSDEVKKHLQRAKAILAAKLVLSK